MMIDLKEYSIGLSSGVRRGIGLLPALLLSGLLLGSCSQDDSVSEVSTKALEIHASLAEAQTGVSVRSTSALTSGSLGVFLSDANEYASRSNVQYTYADGSWSSAAPVYLGVNSATACAYYPYEVSLTDASSVALTSQVYAPGKDFCYAVNNSALSMSSPSWSMQLEHAYSEVTLNITRDASYAGTCTISEASLSNSDLIASGSLDITGGVYSNLAQGNMSYDPGIASLSSGSSTSSSVLLVPVESLSGTLSIALTVDGKALLANIDVLTAGLSKLEAGVNYTINLEIRNSSLILGSVSVSDWSGFTVSGTHGLEGTVESNSYIVSPGGSVNIPVSRANASDLGAQLANVTTGWSSEVLWRDNAGLTIVSDDALQEAGVFTVRATDSSATGNALVVIKDVSGTILWSWQIWVTDYNPASENEVYSGYTFMDRNLGAINDTPGSVGALGMLYQWGRKDPFVGASAIESGTTTLRTLYAGGSGGAEYNANASGSIDLANTAAAPTDVENNLENSVRHPELFYYNAAGLKDWYCGSSTTQHHTLWGISKTVYDPCPAGWKIAPREAFSDLAAMMLPWDETYLGRSLKDIPGSWYPASGYRSYEMGESVVGTLGCYWAAKISIDLSRSLVFADGATVNPSNVNQRSFGFAVRCVQE